MAHSYNELNDAFKKLYSQKNPETPEDLVKILEELELTFSEYKLAKTTEEKDIKLQLIEELFVRYANIKNIIDNVSSSVTPYAVDDLFVGLEGSEEKKIPVNEYGISGEHILERLHRESGLRRKDNYIHKLFVELIGRWIDEWDSVEEIRKFNLKYATGLWLDELASNYGIVRENGQTDDELRERILQKKTERFTTPSVKSHNVTFFSCVRNPKTQLTSKNTYLTNDYLCYADYPTEEYYEDTYVCWRDIRWL